MKTRYRTFGLLLISVILLLALGSGCRTRVGLGMGFGSGGSSLSLEVSNALPRGNSGTWAVQGNIPSLGVEQTSIGLAIV